MVAEVDYYMPQSATKIRYFTGAGIKTVRDVLCVIVVAVELPDSEDLAFL